MKYEFLGRLMMPWDSCFEKLMIKNSESNACVFECAYVCRCAGVLYVFRFSVGVSISISMGPSMQHHLSTHRSNPSVIIVVLDLCHWDAISCLLMNIVVNTIHLALWASLRISALFSISNQPLPYPFAEWHLEKNRKTLNYRLHLKKW